MIPFDFAYYKPTSIPEALETLDTVTRDGQKAMIFNGGTEFITFARMNKIVADAVIDIKGIPDCQVIEIQGDDLIIGSGVPLNKIAESGLFPLLGETVKQVADHTSRNKITIGGNLCSQLMYREGILPLLLADARVKIAGKEGEMTLPLEEIFNMEITLHPNHFLVQIIIDQAFANCPYVSLKKTRLSKIGYPLVSMAALEKDNRIRIAFSGLCEYPFRSLALENSINETNLTVENRITKALAHLPSSPVNDMLGSGVYREFLCKRMLEEVIQGLMGGRS
ncbi:MAG TPA: xanthine dehydrogenase [Paenibacillaceae bacterium]|nr:xanthine dehydrogenase [Paenibacillaceae bacterium]